MKTNLHHIMNTCVTLAFTLIIILFFSIYNQDESVFSDENCIRLPILMYHCILKDPNRANKFTVSPQTFKDDLMYLKENGYETLFISDIINCLEGEEAFPEKPILITLDDGYYNNYEYVYPILKELDMKAIISTVGSYTDDYSKSMDLNPNYAYMTWDIINEIGHSGYIEIQNHSYNLHSMDNRNGILRKKGENKETYRKLIVDDIIKNQDRLKENSNINALAFTYPFGCLNSETEDIMKELGFSATLSCCEGINYISKPEDLFGLKRFNRPSGISTEEFMKKIIDKNN